MNLFIYVNLLPGFQMNMSDFLCITVVLVFLEYQCHLFKEFLYKDLAIWKDFNFIFCSEFCYHKARMLPIYAGVPTTERRNDFSPMMRAKPKSHSLTCSKKE